MPASPDHIRSLIADRLAGDLKLFRMDAGALVDDFDLRASGVIDSLGFLELVTALEDALGVELDLEGLEPGELTVFGPLCRYVAGQAAGVPLPGGRLEAVQG